MQLTLFGDDTENHHASSSGKTLKVSCRQKTTPSDACSGNSLETKGQSNRGRSQKPGKTVDIGDGLRNWGSTFQSGQSQVRLLDNKDALHGESSMPNFLTWPNDAIVCSLSEVLEVGSIPVRYFLSSTACAGILRRAEKRKKRLPKRLQDALEAVANGELLTEFQPETCSPLMAQANSTGGDRPPGSTVDTVGQFVVANCLTQRMHKGINSTVDEGQTPCLAFVHAEQVSPPITSNQYGDHESREGLLVAHALRGEGFDASQDGTGRGTPIVPVISFNARQDPDSCAGRIGPLDCDGTTHAIVFNCKRDGADASDIAPPLMAMNSRESRPNSGGQLAVARVQAFQCQGTNVGEFGTLRQGNGHVTGDVPFVFQTRCSRNGRGMPSEIAPALTSCEGGSHLDTKPHIAGGGYGVRRLTPRECEILMGFPPDFTLIPKPKRGKPNEDAIYVAYLARGGVLSIEECAHAVADGPRYKSLGNSWAVPVVRWIGKRIDSFMKGL